MEESNQKFNIKTQLYYEIQKINQKRSKYQDDKLKLDIYSDIIPILLTNDFKMIRENYITINLGIGVVLGNIEADNIVDNLYEYVIALDILNGINDNESKDYINNRRNFEEVKKIILNKYENIKKEIILEFKEQDELNKMYKEYSIILRNYTHDGVITDWQVRVIDKLLEKYDIDIKDRIRVGEYTRIHNQKISHPNYKTSYTVNNMFQEKYKKYDINKIDYYNYNENSKPVIESYYDIVVQNDGIYINLLEELSNQYDDFYEFEYIIKNILNKLIITLESSIEEMKQYYNDEVLRKVIIDEYNSTKNKFYSVKKLYEKIILEKNKIDNQDKELIKANNLFYLMPNGSRETYLQKDLKDLPNEKLYELRDLLDGLKYDTLTSLEDKQFTSHKKLRNFRELKGDQIRVLYKNLYKNNKLIIGTFIKKTDNDINMYQKMINRDNTLFEINSDNLDDKIKEHEEYEVKVLKYVEENGRKGSR